MTDDLPACPRRQRDLQPRCPSVDLEAEVRAVDQDASFLVVRGFALLGLKRIGGSRFGFRFADDTGKAKAAAMAYLQGESASAKMLFAAERDLNTLLYSQKGNGTENGNNGDIHHRNPVR